MKRKIIVFMERKENYRLRAYEELIHVLSENFEATFYGRGMSENLSSDFPLANFMNFSQEKTAIDVYKEISERVNLDAMIVFNATFGMPVSDFKKIDIPKILITTDSYHFLEKDERYVILNDSNADFDCVFHNYLYLIDEMKCLIKSKEWIHWPCWASQTYDYASTPYDKQIGFFLSGNYDPEYEHRLYFYQALKMLPSHLSVNNLGYKEKFSKNENDRFRDLLLSSFWSPHDGGYNGRIVPRYYESSFAKSVIISPDLGREMQVCGFVNGVNCILFPRNIKNPAHLSEILMNIVRTVDHEKISEAAYTLVSESHTISNRIEAIKNKIEEIIQ